MTGWRVGWAAGDRATIARLVAAHQYLVTCAPTISQTAALGAFTPEGRVARQRLKERFRRRRALMGEELAKVAGLTTPQPDGAFYYFVDVSAFGLPSLDLAMRVLERRKVVTIPGVAFGAGGEGWLRLSYAAAEADIVRGVRAMGEELAAVAEGAG